MNKDGGEKTQESKEFMPPSGEQKTKDSAKDLKEILAEFAQKNRTLFCICLAFSIWFYHGMFDWSTNFGARIKSSSDTLFVVQVFLTAFTLSRILVFINIIDKILRCPIICDVVFLLSWREQVFLDRFKRLMSENCVSKDTYNFLMLFMMQNHKVLQGSETLNFQYLVVEKLKSDNKYKGLVKIDLTIDHIIDAIFSENKIRYSICRHAVRELKGFFLEEKWLPRLFPKWNEKIKTKKYREAIGFTLALATYALSIALIYWIYKYFNPTPIPVITPEQLFFSYVNKHFL